MLEERKRPFPGAEWEPEQSGLRLTPRPPPPPPHRPPTGPAELTVPITPWAVKLAFMVVAGVAVFLGCCLCLRIYMQTHLVLAYVLMSEAVCVCICVHWCVSMSVLM